MAAIKRNAKDYPVPELKLSNEEKIQSKVPSSNSKDVQFSSLENSWTFIISYHIVFWSGISYGLYKFYLLSQGSKKRLELTERESIYGTHQDQNDVEWKVFIPLIEEYAVYGILHLILVQISRCYFPQILKLLYIGLSTIMLLRVIGVLGTSLCFLIPFVTSVVLYTRAKTLIWLTWCSILVVFNCHYFQNFLENAMNGIEEGEYKSSVIVAWIMLKCVSLSLITCDEDPQRRRSSLYLFIDLLAYSLYLPNLVTGPFMPYKDFLEGVNKPFVPWTLVKLLWFIGQCGRFLFWLWLADTFLYFIYAHSIIYYPNYIEVFDQWTLGGYYCSLLLFFLVKYVVMYGMPSVLARAEGYETPDPPRCVLLVKRFSALWRYFDIGLHRFLTAHIYIPFLGDDRSFFKQVQGSVVVFTFIYVWHGTYPSVLWWCVINFFFTILEKLVDRLVESPFYINLENKLLPGILGKMFRLAVNGFFLSLVTNSLVIFLASIQHAQVMFYKIYVKGFPKATLTTVFFFSLMAQAANDLRGFRSRRKMKNT